MTQSAKDFITRIWVSHLVTNDPFGDDFYAQMLGTLQRSSLGTGENTTARILWRYWCQIAIWSLREPGEKNVLNRMVSQVERILKNPKAREPASAMSLFLLSVNYYSYHRPWVTSPRMFYPLEFQDLLIGHSLTDGTFHE